MELPQTYPVYFERKKYLSIALLVVVIISGVITYYSFKTYTVYHIYSAFVCAVSTVYLSWMYFNPFCEIHPEHFEINHGLFSHKKFNYRDIQKIEHNEKKHKLILIFNDHDIIEISLLPVYSKHRTALIEMIKLHVFKDLSERDE